MPIKFACKCGKIMQADEKHAGKLAKCPKCGAAITVPLAEPSASNPRVPAASNIVSATPTAEEDAYQLAQDPAERDRNDLWHAQPPPLPGKSDFVPSATARVPKTRGSKRRARRNGPSAAHFRTVGLLLIVGVTLSTIGFLLKRNGESTPKAGKAPMASSTQHGPRQAVKKAAASRAPRGPGQDDAFQAIYQKGVKLLDDGEIEEAAATFTRAIQRKPDAANAYDARGATYMRQHSHAHALSDFNEAIGLDPNDPKYYANRAIVYREQEKYDLALADHNKCIELSPTTVFFYEQRSLTYFAMGKKDEARRDDATAERLNGRKPAGPSGTAVALAKPPSQPAGQEAEHKKVDSEKAIQEAIVLQAPLLGKGKASHPEKFLQGMRKLASDESLFLGIRWFVYRSSFDDKGQERVAGYQALARNAIVDPGRYDPVAKVYTVPLYFYYDHSRPSALAGNIRPETSNDVSLLAKLDMDQRSAADVQASFDKHKLSLTIWYRLRGVAKASSGPNTDPANGKLGNAISFDIEVLKFEQAKAVPEPITGGKANSGPIERPMNDAGSVAANETQMRAIFKDWADQRGQALKKARSMTKPRADAYMQKVDRELVRKLTEKYQITHEELDRIEAYGAEHNWW